jgi:hypothetical protein
MWVSLLALPELVHPQILGINPVYGSEAYRQLTANWNVLLD